MTIPLASELLKDWDASRPRSQQVALGMSDLGKCRRQAGYVVQGHTPDADAAGRDTGLQAILGTAVHEAMAEAARQSLKIPLHAFVETKEVHFAGLVGHPDLFVEPVLRDLKTVGFAAQLERLRAHGPFQRHRWQVSCYAAALIRAGHTVTTLQINYLSRDTGGEYLWEGPFDMQDVRDAMDWLRQVRTTPVSLLSRDYRPESAICQSCPFFRQCWAGMAVPGRSLRSALWNSFPGTATWAQRLLDARAARQAAEEDEKDAKGALDALRTVERPGETQELRITGTSRVLRFRVERGREGLDRQAVEADYARAGAAPPLARGAPIVKVDILDGTHDLWLHVRHERAVAGRPLHVRGGAGHPRMSQRGYRPAHLGLRP